MYFLRPKGQKCIFQADSGASGVPEFQIGPWHTGQNNEEMKIAERICQFVRVCAQRKTIHFSHPKEVPSGFESERESIRAATYLDFDEGLFKNGILRDFGSVAQSELEISPVAAKFVARKLCRKLPVQFALKFSRQTLSAEKFRPTYRIKHLPVHSWGQRSASCERDSPCPESPALACLQRSA